MQMSPSGSSAINPITSLKSTAQGRSVAMSGQMIFSDFLLKTVFNLQQLVQCPCSNSQASSPPKTALSLTSYEAGEAETAEAETAAESIPETRTDVVTEDAEIIRSTFSLWNAHSDASSCLLSVFMSEMQ
ncbi:hypothetical protein POTOM_011400 [Populus tomentosa]|uniref:Uncharacterized protein n=1 Tax=Populus tomentosa TaxID=118781 RepID=A0A8X8ACU2_POPTO|nr:hypothetical protein POTOM_011400 [Populus tomentosa]